MIDAHVHLRDVASADRLIEIADLVGIRQMGIVCTISPDSINANPAAFLCKAKYPDRIFVFPGLDHSKALNPDLDTPGLAEQIDLYMAMGCDGIKMLEGKPTTRKWLDIRVDSEYFADYFKHAEETRVPILWHVNDPEEFWDEDLIPQWAKDSNWGYDETFVQKEDQYVEIDNVLAKYPNLNIIFAHTYFLSADVPRLKAFLQEHPNVHIDLAPGVEFLHNFSRNVEETQSFFVEFADQIVFGTDLSSSNTDSEAVARAGIVTRWLEGDEDFRIPETAEYILGVPEDGVIKALNLPDEVLEKIYTTNYQRIVGATEPKPFRIDLALEECRRLAAIAEDPIRAEEAVEALAAMI